MKIVDATVFVGVYGSLRVHPWLRGAMPEEDAYSLFLSRAVSMGWSSTGTDVVDALWGMNDAGEDWSSDARVAWFQVGIPDPPRGDLPVQPVLACVRDTLGRVGELDLAAVQFLLPVQASGPAIPRLLSGLNWFGTCDPAAQVDVRVTLDSGDDAASGAAPDILAALRDLYAGPFAVGSVLVDPQAAVVPEPAVVDDLWLGPGRHPVTFGCTVPEWTLDAVGWLVALFVEGCRQAGVRTTVLASVAPDA